MPVRNQDISAAFEEIADLLELEDANPFRIRAYRNAARMVGATGHDLAGLVARGEDLPRMRGIGADLAGKIRELAQSGHCELLDKLRREAPPGLLDLLRVPGIGPKRARILHQELDVHTLEQLHRACEDGRIRALHGFGPRSEEKIRAALESRAASVGRLKLAEAGDYAEPLAEWLRRQPGVLRVDVAGSFRRARDTVGDIDLVAASPGGRATVDRFLQYEDVAEVVAAGPTRATVRLRSGLQVDLRVMPPDSYGAALVYFTGSKAHNIAIRRIAQERGLKISEYGVFRGERRIAGETEESVYRAIGLPWIAPELREDRGEIAAASQGRLPKLVELGDLRGDLHAHTRATDGASTIREMAESAKSFGLEYLAITEHSRKLAMARGLDERRLMRQVEDIQRLNEEGLGIAILAGIEVDILEDGALDLPDRVLGRLDLVVAAVHSGFALSREKQTERLLRAMERPHFSILAHPSGRLLPDRAPYDVDMPKVIRKARERGCFLELNAHPDRLDLTDVHCLAAKAEGVLVAINSDAHRVEDFRNLRYGVGQARRGWLAKEDVLNARPLSRLRRLLSATM